MKSDRELQHDVLEELEWDPSVDAAKIGVSADHGVVALRGTVHTYAERWEAERATKRVAGVEALANDLEVELADVHAPSDADIAQRALSALEWHVAVPHGKVGITVSDGWLTLEGNVEWMFQRRAAEDAVRNLFGVRGITNSIQVKPHVHGDQVKEKIDAALRRNAELDAEQIRIETREGRVILRGRVRSWAEHEDVIDAAWSAPGVTRVEDHLAISA